MTDAAKPAERWLVVGTLEGMGWVAAKVISEADGLLTCDTVGDCMFPRIIVMEGCAVAEHDNEDDAVKAVARAQVAEVQVRPFWQRMVALELEFRQIMFNAAVMAAQPANKVN